MKYRSSHTPTLTCRVGRHLRGSRSVSQASSLPSLFASFCGKILSHLPAAYSLKPKASSLSLFAFFALFCGYTLAAGLCSQHSLSTGTVSLANTQKRTAWHPVAILFRFDASATGTVTISRQTGETTFQLAQVNLDSNQSAVWVPAAPVTFHLDDILIVTSTITNGTVEIIRKGE